MTENVKFVLWVGVTLASVVIAGISVFTEINKLKFQKEIFADQVKNKAELKVF